MRLLWLVLVLVCTRTLEGGAQTVRGQLVDSISRAPLNGAFLTLIDAQGVERARAITDGEGRFTVLAPAPGSYRLRSKRIGFKPYVSPALSLPEGETTTYNAAIDPIPVPLKEVVVAGEQQCDVEAGASVAALWEEIREALAAVAWTSRGGGYWYEITHFERDLTAGGKRQGRDSSWREVAYHQVPFRSAPAVVLALQGYVVVAPEEWTYYGPDADVLLSEPFLKTHCFETKAEQGLVGLAFSPARGRNLPDVKGTLWVDRENAQLRFMEFNYVHLPERLNAPKAGGRMEFMRVPNGAWIISDWVIRMPIARMVSGAYQSAVPRVVAFREAGGSAAQIKTETGTVVYTIATATQQTEPPTPSVASAPVPVPQPPPPPPPPPTPASQEIESPQSKPMRDFEQLQREEFQRSTATDAYGLVREFRPNWLNVRGPNSLRDPTASEIKVYVDGTLFGGLNSLHMIPVLDVQRLQHLRGPDAAARYGQGHTAGVIEVWTRRS